MLTRTEEARLPEPLHDDCVTPTRSVCFIGYMAGARPGFTTSQGLILAGHLRGRGWQIETVSEKHSRWLRAADIAFSTLRLGETTGAAMMEVYSGRNFILADMASAIVQSKGLPIVMVLHGGSLPKTFESHPEWARRVLGRATALVAPSEYLARAARETLRMNATVIPNIADVGSYGFRQRRQLRPRLFWMRGFHDIYDPRMAVRVLGRLVKDYPDARLAMAGRADANQEAVRRYAATCGLSERVTFPGFLDLEGKNRLAGESDVFINTSRVDNMPVAVLEACAMGLPVVATRVGGIADLLTDSKNALLVPAGDAEAMAGAVRRLIEDAGLTERLTAAGRELAMASTPERVLPRWFEVFRQVGLR